MRYFYKIGFYSYEESDYDILEHKIKFTKEEVTDMIAEAIVALEKEMICSGHCTLNFEDFWTSGLSKWLISNKGFVKVNFEVVWDVFGWANVFNISDWASDRTEVDKSLVNLIKEKSK